MIIILVQYLFKVSKNNYLSNVSKITNIFDLFKGSKITNIFDLFKVNKITNIFDIFKVSKITNFVYCYHYYFNNPHY